VHSTTLCYHVVINNTYVIKETLSGSNFSSVLFNKFYEYITHQPSFLPKLLTGMASGGEYSITTEDGRVRPKHVLIEFKK
jgi:hypothetical protein